MASYIYIVSLTKHRIDELIADYMEETIDTHGELYTVRRYPSNLEIRSEPNSVLFVTNGVLENDKGLSEHSLEVLKCMSQMKSFYFIDDHTTWVPTPSAYPLCTVVSQFSNGHPVINMVLGNDWKYFPISNLAVCGEKYKNTGEYEFVYWGHMKPERMEMYKQYIPNDPSTLIIGEKEWKQHFPAITLLPYERDMDKLYSFIAKGKRTVVFGDKYHNGVNIPWRIYEAENCGVSVVIDAELLGDRVVPRHSVEELGEMLSDLSGITSVPKITKPCEDTCEPCEDVCEPCEDVCESIVRLDNISGNSCTVSKPNTQQSHIDSNVDNILAQRATLYGTYKGGVDCRADMLLALNTKYKETHDGASMPLDLLVILGDLVLKMMRIVSDPTHQDSYIDLAGYAKLIKEMKCE